MNEPKLVVHKDLKSPISRVYKILCTNIQFSSLDNSIKTIVVTSASLGKGKAILIINLEIAMAQFCISRMRF